MAVLYNFPSSAFFGKSIPKEKIYAHAAVSNRTKEYFIKDVKKITWSYKLAPETINLPARKGVSEIQALTIELKTGRLRPEVLRTIDRTIPSPILFILSFENQSRYAAAYKRRSEADNSKWVVSAYFETVWMNNDTADRIELPVVLDMAALYRAILENIVPVPIRPGERIRDFIERVERLQVLERDASRIMQRLQKEKQFNRKVEINRQLKRIQKEIEQIKQ